MPDNYDLEERTSKFGEDVIKFCKNLPRDEISRPIIVQLIRSVTSIGANYREARAACSRKDFRNKIFICKKETDETAHWLRMIVSYLPDTKPQIQDLVCECNQLSNIFHASTIKLGQTDEDTK